MALYKGYIKEVLTRDTDWGKMYNIKLSTGDQIGFGKYPPKVKMVEGDYVQVEADLNDKGYLNGKNKTFKVLPKPTEGEDVAPAAASVARGASVGKDDYWKGKEARDVVNDRARNVGAARNTAIAWIDLLMKNDAIKISTKKDEREDQLNTALDEYTKKFMVGIEEENKKNEENKVNGSGGADGRAEPAGDGSDDGDWNA
jgi:hypothetical protein